MAAYATIEDIKGRMTRTLSATEETVAGNLLDDAAILIDSFNSEASSDSKKLVSCRMVIRALGDGSDGVPVGATQGSMSALGYSQSWTMGSNTSVGELYLNRIEKKLLGYGNKIGIVPCLNDPEVSV